MGKIVISSSYKTRKHIAATHCTGFNIGDKQAVEKRFRSRLCKAKMAEKAQFTGVNEHFEAIFNAAEATQIVFQQPARKTDGCEPLTAKTLFLKGSDGVRRPIHQRCAACWSESRAFTQTSPSGVRSFFQKGARVFR